MAKKRSKKKNDSPIVIFIEMMAIIIVYTIIFILGILKLIYNVISFYLSGYKKKSGNGIFKTFFDKGYKGEFILYKKLIKIFGKEYVFTNLYLDNVNTEKTEIDVIAISNKKIYVFEMKNYRGNVYGSEKDVHWTQVFNRFSKYKFYNPLRQNYAHTKALEKYLDVELTNIEPVVVFSNSSKLRKINVNETNNIIQIKDLTKFIKNSERKHQEIFNLDEKKKYSEKLILTENVSDEIKKEHIRQVQEHINKQNYSDN